MLAPEDRPNFFKDLVAAAFSVDPQPITSFCKVSRGSLVGEVIEGWILGQ